MYNNRDHILSLAVNRGARYIARQIDKHTSYTCIYTGTCTQTQTRSQTQTQTSQILHPGLNRQARNQHLNQLKQLEELNNF